MEKILYFLCLFGVIEVSILSISVIRYMIKHKDFDIEGFVLLFFYLLLFLAWGYPLVFLGCPKEETTQKVIVKCYNWGTDDYSICNR